MNELITTQKTALITNADARIAREKAWIAASLAMAQAQPRDLTMIKAEIRTALQDRELAEVAMYSYPRGQKQDENGNWVSNIVTGPSVKLLRELKIHFGFIKSGIDILEMGDDVWIGEAWAIDLRSNNTEIQPIVVRMQRTKNKYGSDKKPLKDADGKNIKIVDLITDERDQLELFFNWAARRERKALETIIPFSVMSAALKQIKETLNGQFKDPTPSPTQRGKTTGEVSVASLLNAINAEVGVTKIRLEKEIGRAVKDWTEDDMVGLQGALNALRDGAISKTEFMSFFEYSKPLDVEPLASKKSTGAADSSQTTTPATGSESTESPASSAEEKGKRTRKAKDKEEQTAAQDAPSSEPPAQSAIDFSGSFR